MDEVSAAISLRQIEYLVAVDELGSISAAAARLHVGQPTISHQLAVLQQRVGVPLHERVGRGVQLTAAGRRLAGGGREALEAARRGVQAARAEGHAETLSLAVVASLAATILPPALASWRRTEPTADIQIREFLRRDELVEALARDTTMVALASPPPDWRGPQVALGWERYAVVLPPHLADLADPTDLADRADRADRAAGAPLPLARLAEVPWVLFDTGHGLHAIVEDVCRRSGFTPRPSVRTGQIDTAVRLAAAGLGPTLVPAASIPAELAHLRATPTPGLRRIVAAFGAIDRPAAAALLPHLTPDRTGLEPPSPDDAADDARRARTTSEAPGGL